MLRPIPSKILKHTVTLNVCTGVDRYQEPICEQQEIKHCVMQPTNETRRTTSNTEVVLRGLMFADARRTLPVGYDFAGAKNTSEAAGFPLTLTFNGEEFTVETVETLYDDEGLLHHYELGLI